MRVTKLWATLIVVLLVASVCMASGDSGSSEVLPDPCPDLSDLNPEERGHKPILYYCQIIDNNDPIGQSQPPPDSAGGVFQITARAYDWLWSFGFLMPIFGV